MNLPLQISLVGQVWARLTSPPSFSTLHSLLHSPPSFTLPSHLFIYPLPSPIPPVILYSSSLPFSPSSACLLYFTLSLLRPHLLTILPPPLLPITFSLHQPLSPLSSPSLFSSIHRYFSSLHAHILTPPQPPPPPPTTTTPPPPPPPLQAEVNNLVNSRHSVR